MNSYTTYPTPAPTHFDMYDRQMNGLHIDGIFFALLFFGSWLLMFCFKVWTVGWNHNPPRKAKEFKSEDWSMPSNWRN